MRYHVILRDCEGQSVQNSDSLVKNIYCMSLCSVQCFRNGVIAVNKWNVLALLLVS